jgi:hypothetical protein
MALGVGTPHQFTSTYKTPIKAQKAIPNPDETVRAASQSSLKRLIQKFERAGHSYF